MSITKIARKLKEAEDYESKMTQSLSDLAKAFIANYKGKQELTCSVVGGDGVVVNFDEGMSVAPASTILQVIKNKGYFNDSDMEENGI